VKLSVVIPARNEEGCVGSTLSLVSQKLTSHDIDYELIVVDDGSTDRTAAIVRAAADLNSRVLLVSNGPPHGFGRAVRAGLDAFSGDAVVIMMADASDSPDDLVEYYRILRDEADCAFGSRFMVGGHVRRYPLPKLVLNRAANAGISALFGLGYNDVTNAFKGYRRYVIESCRPLVSPHFNLTVELPLKAITRGFTYRYVPISWTNRATGLSSFKIKELGSRYAYVILSIWLEQLLVRADTQYPLQRIVEMRRSWLHDLSVSTPALLRRDRILVRSGR
jgi:dolichol-phosphate mannosyltransferase